MTVPGDSKGARATTGTGNRFAAYLDWYRRRTIGHMFPFFGHRTMREVAETAELRRRAREGELRADEWRRFGALRWKEREANPHLGGDGDGSSAA